MRDGLRVQWVRHDCVVRGLTIAVSLLMITTVLAFAAPRQADAAVTWDFAGTYSPTTCGPDHKFSVVSDQTAIFVSVRSGDATTTDARDDLILYLLHNGQVVAGRDSIDNPEFIVYAPVDGVPAGTYAVRVCPFTAARQYEPYNYVGTFTYDDSSLGA